MMQLPPELISLGLSAALGLLVGLQRQFAGTPVAGIRTFPLFAVLGTLCALLAPYVGNWLIGVGFVAVTAMLILGNVVGLKQGGAGLTTELAALVMYVVGVWVVFGDPVTAVVVAAALAVLLHVKKPLHNFIEHIGERDFTAVMRFVLISLVILPLLPDKTYGPMSVLNPRNIWLMVVLIVGVQLAGYILYRVLGQRAGSLLGGVIGGLVSSTATTVAFARSSHQNPGQEAFASQVIVLASTVAFVRIVILGLIIVPAYALAIAYPLAVMIVVLALAVVVLALKGRADSVDMPAAGNPAELGPALIFGGIYALVTLGIAAAKDYLGTGGLYVVAIISGLTDMDAVTLSSSRLMASQQLAVDIGWRLILIAGMSNLVFKGITAWVLGGRALGWRVNLCFGIGVIVGVLLVWLWPDVAITSIEPAPDLGTNPSEEPLPQPSDVNPSATQ